MPTKIPEPVLKNLIGRYRVLSSNPRNRAGALSRAVELEMATCRRHIDNLRRREGHEEVSPERREKARKRREEWEAVAAVLRPLTALTVGQVELLGELLYHLSMQGLV